MIWQRAIRLWADAMGFPTQTLSVLRYEPEGRDLARFCQGDEQEYRRVLDIYAEDPWVQEHKPMVTHFARHYPRYAVKGKQVDKQDIKRQLRNCEQQLTTFPEHMHGSVKREMERLEKQLKGLG